MNPTQQLGSYEHIALSAIRPSATNPRKNFDPVALGELARSIRSQGVIEPILIRPILDVTDSGFEEFDYEIVTGERRWRASHLVETVDVIPAIVREMSDEEAADLQMVENLQRADLHAVEEAEGYRALLASGHNTVEDVAKKAGKTVSHVARTLKLLLLELPIKTLFHAGHLTLGHALLLARLTPADQDRAVRELLNVNQLPKSQDMQEHALRRIDEKTKYNTESRLIRHTEAELRTWIGSHVLLSLGKAPWSPEDALLVPEAGPCTTCPKRSGSNAALFADITVDEDVCLDAACFGTKQKAFVTITIEAAAESSVPLLKLSSKKGQMPVAPGAKKALQRGQWLFAKAKSCPHVVKGILIDEPNSYDGLTQKPGDVMTVCADQACKVHAHTVEQPAPPKGSTSSGAKLAESAADREKRVKSTRILLEERENRVRRQVLGEIATSIAHYPGGIMRYALSLLLEEGFDQDTPRSAVVALSLPAKLRVGWEGNEDASKALRQHILKASAGDLPNIAYVMISTDAMKINPWNDLSDAKDLKEDRERMWAMAAAMDVDADAVAAAVDAVAAAVDAVAAAVDAQLYAAAELEKKAKEASPNAELPPVKKPKKKATKAAQTVRKAAAAKKFPAKKAHLTPQQRTKIVNATKERFAKRSTVDGKSAGAGERAEQAGA